MTDTPVQKGFWRAIRAALRWIAHVCLIPVVFSFTTIGAGLTHLGTEANKIASDIGRV